MFGLENALKVDNDKFSNHDLYWCIKHYEHDLVKFAYPEAMLKQ